VAAAWFLAAKTSRYGFGTSATSAIQHHFCANPWVIPDLREWQPSARGPKLLNALVIERHEPTDALLAAPISDPVLAGRNDARRLDAMRVAIAGGHGQIALRLARALSERGDEAVALIRNPDQSDDVRQAGAEPAVVDLEHASEDDVTQAIAGSDAVVFAAGAGPGSGSARKETMDYGGAAKLIAAAKQAGISRYVIVSSMGANANAPGDDTFSVYLRAKGRADEAVLASGLDATTTPARAASDSARASHAGESPATTSQRSSSLCWTRRPRSAGLWN
jgi:NAD(P)H-binding